MTRTRLSAFRSLFREARVRLGFYGDLPGLMRIMQFRQLRRDFYRQYWAGICEDARLRLDEVRPGLLRVRKGGISTFVLDHQVMLDDPLTLRVMGDKPLTLELLGEAGAPLPAHVHFEAHDPSPALSLMERCGTIVVKPASGTGAGRGVTTGIRDAGSLAKAARRAAGSGTRLLAEEQVNWPNYRLLYLDGELIDAIRRDPPVLRGDGRSTIRQLIDQENRRRLSGAPFVALTPLTRDQDMANWLAEADRALGTRPAAGETFVVKRAVNENDSNGNHGVVGTVSPAIAAAGGELVRRLGVRLAGLDLYCRDIGGEYSAENCRIGEVNTTPGLHHHVLIADPAHAVPVGRIILDHIFEARERAIAGIAHQARHGIGRTAALAERHAHA